MEKEYPFLDDRFPTVDPAAPYELTEEEEEIMERLEKAFAGCEKLQNHMRFLLKKVVCTKFTMTIFSITDAFRLEKTDLERSTAFRQSLPWKSLYDALEGYVRKGFFALDEQEKEQGKNIMWCIWQHPDSPLFGKDKMATFERYFIEAKETHLEKKNPYYELLERKVVNQILEEFGLHPEVPTLSTACSCKM